MADLSYEEQARQNSVLLSQVHEAAFKAGITFGMGLWDRYPPGITMQVVKAGIQVSAIDFDKDSRELIVMDDSGQLYRCSSLSSPPVLL